MCFSIEMTKEANYLENRFNAISLKSHFEQVEKIFSLQEILPPLEFHAFLGNPTARTWRGLFMRRHGLVAFESFYEWVEKKGKKQLINFFPKEKELMWAPCIWDDWTSPYGEIHFQSFALLTDDPPRD